MKMHQRYLYLCGVLAPLLFVFMTILGGALRSGYNHLAHTVSELFSPGAPNKLLLDPFFITYTLLMILFGVGVWLFVRTSGQARPEGQIGAALLIGAGLASFLTATFFPQDPWGTPFTFPGRMHLVFSGVTGLAAMLAYLLLGLWFRRTGLSPGLALFSFTIVAAAIVSTMLFIASVDGPYMGLGERLAAFTGLLWTFVLGWWLFTREQHESMWPTGNKRPSSSPDFEPMKIRKERKK
jgi:hypothetical membrane protein